MENFPGTNAAETDSTSPKTRERRRARLSRAVIGEATPPAVAPVEGASEKPKKTLRLDKAFIKLVVKEKLEDSEAHRQQEVKPETAERVEAEAPAELLSPDMEVPDESSERTNETNTPEEQQKDDAKEASYEVLQDYALGANEFIGDMVVSLHDPLEERTMPATDDAEEVTRLVPATNLQAAGPSPERTTTAKRPQRPPLGENEGAPAVVGTGVAETSPSTVPHTDYAELRRHAIDDEAFRAVQREHALFEADYSAAQAVEAIPRPTTKEDGITKTELNDAIYRATKAGQNRGVVTGLVVGAGYEHFKHKKVEKKNEKRYEARAKQVKKDQQANTIRAEEQDRRRNELDDRLYATERRLDDAETSLLKRPEQAQGAHPEKQPIVIPEQARAEQAQVPSEHRLESSAWLNTEVDKKTGKPVENPTFAYGEEYHKERAQENMLVGRSHGDAASAGPAAAGAGGGGNGSHAGSVPGSSSSLPPMGLPSATTQGPPSDKSSRAAKAGIRSKASSGQAAGPIWPWLVALLAIVISLALILH